MGRMTKLFALTFLVALLLLPGMILAQDDAVPIDLGDTVTGEVDEAVSRGEFTFSSVAGTHVIITLESVDFDTYLVLLNAAGDVLAEDDDGAEGVNSQLEFTLAEAGDYTIIATSLREYLSNGEYIETGSFTLTLEEGEAPPATPTPLPPPPTPEAEISGTISVGETVEGTATEDAPRHSYVFEANAGETVTITLISAEFDTYLILLDVHGDELQSDDDSAGNLSSRIGPIELPEDGTYTIVATSYGHESGSMAALGDYTLSLEAGDAPVVEASPVPFDLPPDAPPVFEGTLVTGDVIAGSLSDATPNAAYTFEALAGDVVTIELSSADFDPYLTLLNADDEELAYDDDSAGELNSLILGFVIPDDGTYTVLVESYGHISSGSATPGSYTLALSADEPVVSPPPDDDDVMLMIGDEVAGTLTDDVPYAEYSVFAFANDVVTITLVSDDFDAYLVLLDEAGNELAANDDGAGGLDAGIISFIIPEDGVYTVVAQSFGYQVGGESGVGAYTLALAEGVAPIAEAIAVGDVSEGYLEVDMSNVIYTFEASAGDVVTITLVSDDFDAYLYLLGADGYVLVEDDDSGGNFNSQIGPIEIPEDGTYTIQVDNFEGGVTEGRYTLTLMGDDVIVRPQDGDISVGEMVIGELTLAQPTVEYTFYALAGEVVTITLESLDFDSYLLLYDANGIEIGRDDDGAGDLNSRLRSFIIPEDGFYTIAASSYGQAMGDEPTTGVFSLTLDSSETLPVVYGTISIGETVEGVLEESVAEYTFDANTGDVVTITLRSDTFDTYLLLYDAFGMELIRDDDSAGDLDSRISAYTIPTGGTYTIVVDSFGHATGDEIPAMGDYALTLAAAVIHPIEYTQAVAGVIEEENPVALYRFSGSAGDLVTIVLDTDSRSLNMRLEDEYGYYLGDAYETNNIIGPLTLPETGEYRITVDTYDIYQVQGYTLRVDRIVPQAITLDTKIETSFEDASVLYYSFEGQEGDSVSVRVESDGAVDTQIIINGPDGYEMMRDDDGGAGFDPEIQNLILYGDGTYTVLVRPYILGDDGDITVSIEGHGMMDLDDEAQVIRISDKNPEGVVAFDGVAGERVRLSARVLVNSSAEPRIEIWQADRLLASNSIGMVERLLVEFVVPEDGPVRVTLVSDYYSAAIIEFSIERLTE
jgi:hypothetical protein